MRTNRFVLLSVSVLVVVFLLGGGLMVRVGAAESSYRQAVLFAEVLSLVMENYVDPVEAHQLLVGAYEGMLGGLDPNGAYLSPEEVAEWKKERPAGWVGAGLTVLKAGRMVQVVAVDVGSSADDAGVQVGDQIRRIDGRPTRDLSLAQSRRLLEGPPGSRVTLDLLRPADGFSREDGVELIRQARHGHSYDLQVRDDVVVLRPLTLHDVELDALSAELAEVAKRGIDQLLLDVRNLADGGPRDAAALAGLFVGEGTLQLRDPSGRLVDTVRVGSDHPAWKGDVAVLTNGATADGGEALAVLVRSGRHAKLFGESTYGLGAEARLYELEDGSGLLVSSVLWEADGGKRWNGDGVEPDEVVEGQGDAYADVVRDQLDRVLERVHSAHQEALRPAA